MNDLEDALRSALRSLPEPEMRLPVHFPETLRRKYQRRRRVAPVAVAGLVAAVALTTALWQSSTDSSSRLVPAATPSPTTPPPTSAAGPAVIPTQQLHESALPGWAESSDNDPYVWSGSPHAFTVGGSPMFVVGESVPGPLLRNDPTTSKKPEATVEFQRTNAQVDTSGEPGSGPSGAQAPSGAGAAAAAVQANLAHLGGQSRTTRNPSYGCATGSAGTEGDFGLSTPALMQLRCWPTLQENIWVWSRLPSNVTTIAYVLDGKVQARSTTLDGVGAIRIPRPSSAAADQGQLEGLDATGDVVVQTALKWIA